MSKKAVDGLKPEILWQRFYEISQVPRPSKKEEKIREYVKNFAKENNLVFKEDNTGNIVILLPASPGYEKNPVVVLQGHLDMVCEKNRGTEHNFDEDPIKLIRDGDWLKADGTTLGSDNGIGVAAALAIVSDKSSVHGPVEILCTVDEETGLTGANGLKSGFIKGKILLNMDSEEDGTFYVGCSGGQDTIGTFNIQSKKIDKTLIPYELMITGLKGGHSGLDIQNGRANAIKLLGRLLDKFNNVKFRIAEITGGSKRNAIPREAEAIILIDSKDEKQIQNIIDEFVGESLLEIGTTDGGLKVIFQKKEGEFKRVFRKKFAKKLINTILAIPHGIMAMSPDIPDLVETSTNLATIVIEDDKIKIGTSQRSSIESAKRNISLTVSSVFELAGADEINIGDGYPGWKPDLQSKILKLSREVYKDLFGKDAEIKAIHAGLECGILGDKYPRLDMVSFGPTIEGAHSPDEKINIKDVEKFYDLLKGILTRIAMEN